MSKDKISDYSSTANSNTDIAAINIDEGCAPSGINNAIRALMAQLKNWQSGAQDVYITPAGSVSAPAVTTNGDTNTGVYFPAADKIALATGGTQAVIVDASQNVGIGTASPSARLAVGRVNSAEEGGQIDLHRASDNASAWAVDVFGSTSTPSLRFIDNVASATRMSIDGSGNVGIGTSSPSCKLQILAADGANSFLSQITGGTKNPYLTVSHSESGGYSKLNADGSLTTGCNMVFATAGTERARIDSSGNLLVGDSSGANSRLYVKGSGTSSAASAVRVQDSAAADLFLVRNDGYVISASTYGKTTGSAANMTIDVSGFLYRSTSALKYKQDVRDLESIDVSKFRPVRYKSNCENDDQSIDRFGVIADEVDAAGITELVNYGAEGEVEGFQYERLTVVLLKAIQEQQAMIASQSELITTLTERITALEQA